MFKILLIKLILILFFNYKIMNWMKFLMLSLWIKSCYTIHSLLLLHPPLPLIVVQMNFYSLMMDQKFICNFWIPFCSSSWSKCFRYLFICRFLYPYSCLDFTAMLDQMMVLVIPLFQFFHYCSQLWWCTSCYWWWFSYNWILFQCSMSWNWWNRARKCN